MSEDIDNEEVEADEIDDIVEANLNVPQSIFKQVLLDEEPVIVPVEPKVKKKYKKNYINNADFTAAIAEWVAAYKEEKAKFSHDLSSFVPPPMSSYIGECFMKLVNGVAKKPNYSGYTFIDDMKSEALLTCMKYAHNFNIQKSNNAFGYFTQYINNSFVGMINAEKKLATTKFDYIKEICSTSDKYDYKQLLNDQEDSSLD